MCTRIEKRIQEIQRLFQHGIKEHDPETAMKLQKELNDLLANHCCINDDYEYLFEETQY